MEKQSFIYPNNGILFSNKQERTIDKCNKMNEFQKCYAEQKKPATIEDISCNLLMWSSKEDKANGRTESRSVYS